MTISTLTKISADAHVDEPHDLWFDRLPEHLRERAPRRIEADDAGGWALVVDGSPIGWNDATADDAREQDAAREAAASVDARRAMFAEDGIHGEIVFPTIGLYAWTIADPKVGTASCDIYNRWIMERLGGDSAIRLAAMIPTWASPPTCCRSWARPSGTTGAGRRSGRRSRPLAFPSSCTRAPATT
jgi:hypothetical protein